MYAYIYLVVLGPVEQVRSLARRRRLYTLALLPLEADDDRQPLTGSAIACGHAAGGSPVPAQMWAG